MSPISDRLAQQALAKIREQEEEINHLRKRSDLGAAIQKTLENPSSGQGRNHVVSNIVRPALFKEKPVSKAAEADRKKKLRRELQIAKGLRPKDD